VREHVEAVSVAAIALLLGVIAWGAYNRKVNRLTDAVKVERARTKVESLEARRATHEERVAELTREDVKLGEAITAAQREAVAVRESVKGKNDEEVAARFNRLYR
jgi:hypothetical protein